MDDRVRVFGEIISDQTRLSIVEMLYNGGPLRWIEIMDNLESQYGRINPNRLRFHLNFMLKREAVLKDVEREGSRDVKYFKVSDWVKEFSGRLSGKEALFEKFQKRTVLPEAKEQHVASERETINEVEKSSRIGPPSEEALRELKIDPEFSELLDPLDIEEWNELMVGLKAHGCVYPIIVWNGTVIEGHNRYSICRDNDIPFQVKEIQFEDKKEAEIWILTNQIAKRNVASFRRYELILERDKRIKSRKTAKERSKQ